MTIERAAFFGCDDLSSITLSDNITSIGDWAFRWTNIDKLLIPKSVSKIGAGLFYKCKNLNSIEVDKNNKYYDSRNNCNAIMDTKTNELVAGCKNSVIPNNTSAICKEAFDGCCGMTSISIPNNVKDIGAAAFADCEDLISVQLPTNIKEIRFRTFHNCNKLTSINIPNGVTAILDRAFEGCAALTSITIPESVTNIDILAFDNCI